MTDRHRRGEVAVPLTTAAVTAAATAAVAWAAATPVHTAASAAGPPEATTQSLAQVDAETAAETTDAARTLARAQRTLAEVRDDVVRLSRIRLPRAATAGTATVVSPGLPPAQVQIPAASPVVVPALPAPAPPPTHTTTGASGAPRP